MEKDQEWVDMLTLTLPSQKVDKPRRYYAVEKEQKQWSTYTSLTKKVISSLLLFINSLID